MGVAVEQPVNTSETFKDAFSLFVGPGKRFSVEAISEATGIGVRTVKSHLWGETTPGYAALMAYMRVLPDAFVTMALAPAGIAAVQRTEPDENVCGHKTLSAMLSRSAMLAKALEDNRIDHREALQLAPEFEQVGVECIGFARSLKERNA
ncbi:MAG TPA: hypothetical protein VIK75_10250 [Calditerricola sp.]